MQLKQKTKYAIRILLCLAQSYRYMNAVELSGAADVPSAQINRVAGELRDAGIVETGRGCKGGYRLKRAPSLISLYQVMVAMDDLFSTTGHSAEPMAQKALRPEDATLAVIQREVAVVLQGITLDQFCNLVEPYSHSSVRKKAANRPSHLAGTLRRMNDDQASCWHPIVSEYID